MAQKVLLLDIDGVLLKDKLILHNVINNVVRFVQNTTPIKHLDIIQARHLNKTLYKSHGHTLAGLRVAFPSYKDYYTNSFFNRHIYDTSLLNHLYHFTKDTENFRYFKIQFQSIQDKCNDNGIPIYIYTNSPLEWALPIINQLQIDPENVFHSNHNIFNDILLKPDVKLYNNVYQILREKHPMSRIECIFVDDSPINLLPILSSSYWTPIHYDETNTTPITRMNYIKMISSLPELKIHL